MVPVVMARRCLVRLSSRSHAALMCAPARYTTCGRVAAGSAQRANGLRNPGCTGRSQQDRVVVQLRYFVDGQRWESAAPAHQLLLGIQTGRLVKQPARERQEAVGAGG